jgi:hypothetical protein
VESSSRASTGNPGSESRRPGAELRRARKQLVEYCGQDTLALMKVHRRLDALA